MLKTEQKNAPALVRVIEYCFGFPVPRYPKGEKPLNYPCHGA